MRAPPARIMAALRATFDLSVAEAWRAHRLLKEHLDRPVGLIDLVRHPRITAAEVREARIEIVKETPHAEPIRPRPPREPIGREPIAAPPAFVEFEITATTKGHTPRRRE